MRMPFRQDGFAAVERGRAQAGRLRRVQFAGVIGQEQDLAWLRVDRRGDDTIRSLFEFRPTRVSK